jgi:MtN3 and saliva related transmembrane protein
MSTTTLLAVAASSWGIAMALAPILQIRHMLATRSSGGISIGYLAVLLVGFVLWFAYGIALQNIAIVVPNTIAFVVCSATIAIALQFRRTA